MQEFRQGRKSRIDVLPDGSGVRKTYNESGVSAEKYRREIGFYTHYAESGLIPRLVGYAQDKHITIEKVEGQRLADVLPLKCEEMESLAEDYIRKLMELFEVSAGIGGRTRAEYYDGLGAEENLALVLERLEWLYSRYDENPIIADLRGSVSRIEPDTELLIKLDWNVENVFLLNGRIHRFIDFEQAFIGTRAILAGILLHNPVWPAARIFRGLRDAGFINTDVGEFRNYICYGFSAVLVDSIRRRGALWDSERLSSAFERHVTAGYSEIVNAV